jgi:hypothetical protein
LIYPFGLWLPATAAGEFHDLKVDLWPMTFKTAVGDPAVIGHHGRERS